MAVSKGAARERIVAAALKLFAERGFDATATKAVADEAGVPSGLVFYYFDDKETLLDEVLKTGNLAEVIEQAVQRVSGEPPAKALKEVGTRLFQWLRTHEDLASLFFKEMTSHRPVAKDLRDLRRRSIAHVAAYLDGAVRRHELEPAKTRLMAQAFVSSILLAAIFDRETNAASFVRDLTGVLLGKGMRRTL